MGRTYASSMDKWTRMTNKGNLIINGFAWTLVAHTSWPREPLYVEIRNPSYIDSVNMIHLLTPTRLVSIIHTLFMNVFLSSLALLTPIPSLLQFTNAWDASSTSRSMCWVSLSLVSCSASGYRFFSFQINLLYIFWFTENLQVVDLIIIRLPYGSPWPLCSPMQGSSPMYPGNGRLFSS